MVDNNGLSEQSLLLFVIALFGAERRMCANGNGEADRWMTQSNMCNSRLGVCNQENIFRLPEIRGTELT